MNYEQKYKQALERARQFIEHPLQEDSENIAEYIFPELTMSEDERMKDYIKDVIQAAIIPKKENKQKMIAWLEKQGKALNPDKVIGWLVANICDYDYYVKLFKKDFDL